MPHYTIFILYFLLIADNFLREFLRGKFKAVRFKKSQTDKKSSFLMVFMITFVAIFPIFYFAFITDLNLQLGFFVFGLILMILAICLRYLSMIELKSFYSGNLTILKNQKIIKTGVYKYIRHPGYASNILLLTGFSLGFGDYLFVFLTTIISSLCISYRIKTEENMLLSSFPEEYKKYQNTTPAIIPKMKLKP